MIRAAVMGFIGMLMILFVLQYTTCHAYKPIGWNQVPDSVRAYAEGHCES